MRQAWLFFAFHEGLCHISPPQRSSDLRVAVESRQKALLSRSFLFYCIFQLRVLLAHQTAQNNPHKRTLKKIMLPGGINLLVLRWMEFLLTLLRQGEGRSALHGGWGGGGRQKEEALTLHVSLMAEPGVVGITTDRTPSSWSALVLSALSLCTCKIVQNETGKPASFAL